MATFDQRVGALERRYLTATALQKKVFAKQTEFIADILGATGVYMGHYADCIGAKFHSEHIDTDNPENTWFAFEPIMRMPHGQTAQTGLIKFSNPRKGGAPFMERDMPYETDREAEEAISMTVSNRTGAIVNRNIQRDVSLGTRNLNIKEDTINWDLNVGFGFEVGKKATENTFGAHAVAKFETSFGLGGNHKTGSHDESIETITRKVSDSFQIPPHTKHKITGTYDKINMEQKYRIYYPIDFNIECTNFGISNDTYHRFYQRYFGDGKMEFDSIGDLISCYLGIRRSDNDFQDGILSLMDKEDHISQRVLSGLEGIADKNNRMIVQNGTISYNDASDISLDLWELGSYDKTGELIL